MSIEAMKQALERVDRAIDEPNITMSDGKALKEILRQLHLIKDALHAAISEASMQRLTDVQQEPVAWMVYTLDGKSVCVTDNPQDFTEQHRALPLYTHPPRREWVELTDDEIDFMASEEFGMGGFRVKAFACTIEAKLKEKNS